MSRRTRLRLAATWLGQFAVVMFGVLAALALDRWVQSIDTRATEQTYLQALHDDFTENRAIAAAFERTHGESLARAQTVLDALASPEVAADDFTRLAAAVEFASWSYGLRFVATTWDDLIATGRSAVLRDRELRAALRRFYARRAMLEGFEAEWQTLRFAYRDAVLLALAPQERIALVPIFFGDTTLVVPGDARALHRALRATPAIGARVADVLLAAQGGRLLYPGMAARADTVLALLERSMR